MEFFLNSAWALLALIAFSLWLRFNRQESAERRVSFTALAMLIVILFPVISVSDDLWAMQNPAEVDCSVRREHAPGVQHTLFPVAALPQAGFSGLTIAREQSSELSFYDGPPAAAPLAAAIQSRPPPAA